MKETFVLLAGWGRRESTYKRLAATVPQGSQVFIIPQAKVNYKNPSKDILQFLEKHQLDKVSLIGHSFGGAMAIKFATEHPEKINHLYLIDAIGVYDKVSSPKRLLSLFKTAHHNIGKKWSINSRDVVLLFTNPIYYFVSGRYIALVDLQKEITTLTVPTTIIWGENDKVVSVKRGEMMHHMLSHSKFIVLPKLDHDWIFYYPQGFWDNV